MSLGKIVIDRCNLTALLEPGQEDTPEFLAQHKVHVIASLPCYSAKNVNLQRGSGVFQRSIEALRILNDLGYGRKGSGLKLDLVYNPLGEKYRIYSNIARGMYFLRGFFAADFTRERLQRKTYEIG